MSLGGDDALTPVLIDSSTVPVGGGGGGGSNSDPDPAVVPTLVPTASLIDGSGGGGTGPPSSPGAPGTDANGALNALISGTTVGGVASKLGDYVGSGENAGGAAGGGGGGGGGMMPIVGAVAVIVVLQIALCYYGTRPHRQVRIAPKKLQKGSVYQMASYGHHEAEMHTVYG